MLKKMELNYRQDFVDTASQIVKVQAGERDNYNRMSMATDTALGGIVGTGIGETLGAASAVDVQIITQVK